MDNDYQYVIEQQKNRFSVLEFIWKDTREQPQDSRNYSDAKEVASATGIDGEDLFTTLQYLDSEGLIEIIQHMGELPYSRVTHSGIVEMESAITKPTQDTRHFFSSVIINVIETMNQTNINAGRDAVGNISSSEVNAPITNTVSYTNNETAEILQAIAELKQNIDFIPNEFQDIATDALDTLKDEIEKPSSSTTKVKSAWMTICFVVGKLKDATTFGNAALGVQEHLHKLNIDFSNIQLPHF